jgi:peptide/nickel transport system substrate-binding protein
MGSRFLKLLVGVAVVAAMLVATGSGSNKVRNGGTIVFGAATDPVVLDGALVSDGESLRPINQMFEGLVGLKNGSTQLKPLLATKWKASKNGLSWTFTLRRGVRFHDGTKFNAAAVCYNFNRWYGFPNPLQDAGVSYYWNTVFGGFAHPGPGNPGPSKSLYKSCQAKGQYTALIKLTRRSSSFLGALALTNFGIASPTALRKYKANAGTVDSSGVFHPAGTYATRHPTGTGPYMFSSWSVGNRLVLVRNKHYWGKRAHLDKVIFRPISDNAARLQALQTGEVQGYDLVDPADIKTIRNNKNLKLLNRPAFNVAYVGMNQTKPPMNKLAVRQAVAYGLDRSLVVRAFYAGRGQVANQFLPTQLVGYAHTGVPSYTYNPNKAKALLRAAGLTLPVPITFWYPTNVSRPYMPNPQANAQAFGASLEKSGFKVTFKSEPWRPDYLSDVQTGNAQVYLAGWTGDFGDPANFLNVHFGQFNPQFGFHNNALFNLLRRADSETNLSKRAALYRQASINVMKFLPMVPYVHSSPALAFKKNVNGYIPSPVSLEPFSTVYLGS